MVMTVSCVVVVFRVVLESGVGGGGALGETSLKFPTIFELDILIE